MQINNKNNGFVWLPILLGILGLVIVGGGVSAYMLGKNSQPQTQGMLGSDCASQGLPPDCNTDAKTNPYPTQNTTTLSVSLCDNLYVKDSHTLYLIPTEYDLPAYHVDATTTVDYSAVVKVAMISEVIYSVTDQNITSWAAEQKQVGSPRGEECAPGNIDIVGSYNNQGIFIASAISQTGQ